MADMPKYLQVADVLRKEIADGVFSDGQTLMTEEELRVRFNVSRQTVRQAISLLEDDGLVDRRRGSGTYVRHGSRRRCGTINVGVVSSYISTYIFPGILSGIESVLNEHDCIMNLSATYNDPTRERVILERLLDSGIDGIIVDGVRTAEGNVNKDVYHKFIERNIPILFMNAFYDDMPDIPHVAMDDYGGGRKAARELVRRGYRSLACLFKRDDIQGRERGRGFMDELSIYGLVVPEENIFSFTTDQYYTMFDTPEGRRFLDHLSEKGTVDAVCCYNDIFAVNLMGRLSMRGVRFPEDIGVIGFDNSSHAIMAHPSLTTLGHPKEKFGAAAAEKILNMINGEKEKSLTMNWELIERDSLPSVIIR